MTTTQALDHYKKACGLGDATWLEAESIQYSPSAHTAVSLLAETAEAATALGGELKSRQALAIITVMAKRIDELEDKISRLQDDIHEGGRNP